MLRVVSTRSCPNLSEISNGLIPISINKLACECLKSCTLFFFKPACSLLAFSSL
nr:MAG TPA: hypothetical protein [Caudoviricetes sp.]